MFWLYLHSSMLGLIIPVYSVDFSFWLARSLERVIPPGNSCLMAVYDLGCHNVYGSIVLVLLLPGDREDNSEEPSCPYQVARKYLKSSIPGSISIKGLLRN